MDSFRGGRLLGAATTVEVMGAFVNSALLPNCYPTR